jgi:hypothetical protein
VCVCPVGPHCKQCFHLLNTKIRSSPAYSRKKCTSDTSWIISLKNFILNMTASVACRCFYFTSASQNYCLAIHNRVHFIDINFHLFSITYYCNLLQSIYLTVFNSSKTGPVITVTNHSNCIIIFPSGYPRRKLVLL